MNQIRPVPMIAMTTPGTHNPRISAQIVCERLVKDPHIQCMFYMRLFFFGLVYIFMAPFKIIKCTKLRWFQTGIHYKILVTNKFLYQLKTIDSHNCSFCSTIRLNLKNPTIPRRSNRKISRNDYITNFEWRKFYSRQFSPKHFEYNFNACCEILHQYWYAQRNTYTLDIFGI